MCPPRPHLPRRALLQRPVGLARRVSGAALVALVLLSLVAATIGMLVIRQVATSARSTGAAVAVDASRDIARQTLDQIRAELTSDPELAFRQVLADELPRVCPTDGSVHGPGELWPATCGTGWTYQNPDSSDEVRVMLEPQGAVMQVTVVASTGPVDAGVVATLQRVAAADQTLWSLGDVILDDLLPSATGGQISVELAGQVYGSQVVLPSNDRLQLGSVQLLSEDGIVGVPTVSEDPDIVWRYYKDNPTTAERLRNPPLRDVRTVVPQRTSPAAMVAAFERMAADACPTSAGEPTAAAGHASYLCLAPGAQVRAADGTVATIPSSAEAVAVRAASSPDHVEVVVYDRTQVAFDCVVDCDLLAMERQAQTNLFTTTPDASQVFVLLRPASGLVGVRDLEPHLEPCGPAFLTPDEDGCAPASHRRLPTVVAGTVDTPTDVYVSGPARAAAATAGAVVVPYWARPLTGSAATDRILTIDLPAFALGVDRAAAVTSLPARAPNVRVSVGEDDNWGVLLDWHGALITPSGLPAVDGWETVRFNGQPAGSAAALPSPSSRWEVSTRREWLPINDCPAGAPGNADVLPRRCVSLVAG